MKGTYDDNSIKFYVSILEKDKVVGTFPFEVLYGANASSICEVFDKSSITLVGKKEIKYDKHVIPQKTNFTNINPHLGITFEDTIKEHLMRNYSNFSGLQKVHALAFLERYTMEYEEIKQKVNKI